MFSPVKMDMLKNVPCLSMGCDLSIMLQYQELSTSSKQIAATRPKSNVSDNQIGIRRHGDIGGYSEAQRFNVRLRAGDTKRDE